MNYKRLKRGVEREFKQRLESLYGFKTPKDWLFYTLNDNRIWLLSSELVNFDTKNVNVELIGLYFSFFDSERLRLSPEGAQIVGLTASKNVLLISDEDAEQLIRGFDLDINTNLDAEYIIIKTRKGVLGVGKNHKDKLLCQFKKNRRIRKL